MSKDGLRSLLVRLAGFFLIWVVIAGIKPVDLAVGFVAAIVAAFVSLSLMPPAPRRMRLFLLAVLVLRFLRQSM